MSLEEARRGFYSALEMLKKVHTEEELDAVKDKVKLAREALWEVDPEFRAMVEENQRKARRRGTEMRKGTDTAIYEGKTRAAKERAKARTQLEKTDVEVGEWVQKHKFKVLTPEEAKTESKLICPICHGPDRFNIMDGVPTCFHDPRYGPPHKLVPESELKNYNRAYRRRWKKR